MAKLSPHPVEGAAGRMSVSVECVECVLLVLLRASRRVNELCTVRLVMMNDPGDRRPQLIDATHRGYPDSPLLAFPLFPEHAQPSSTLSSSCEHGIESTHHTFDSTFLLVSTSLSLSSSQPHIKHARRSYRWKGEYTVPSPSPASTTNAVGTPQLTRPLLVESQLRKRLVLDLSVS
jgi:hypothetical protein